MAAFSFRLQKVLNYKQQVEDQKKQELFHLLKIFYEEEKVLHRLNELLLQTLSEFETKQEGDLDIQELLFYSAYIARVNREIEAQREKLVKLAHKIEKKRGEVIEASKERKILEQLREKKYKEFQRTEGRREQKFLDEIGNNAYVRAMEGRK